jgi:hypothetical protein
MAQTKRKRRTKHRGNAAGKVEVRGRTGRAPTADERKQQSRAQRLQRFDKPPTWRSAVNRAGIATLLFIVAVIVIFRQSIGAGLGIGALMFLFYIPLGYYTDAFIYRRRQSRKSAGGGPKAKV